MGGQILTLYFGEGEIGGKGRCRFEISLLPFYESYNSTSDIVPEIYSSIRAPGQGLSRKQHAKHFMPLCFS
jgi:hypothetical protein